MLKTIFNPDCKCWFNSCRTELPGKKQMLLNAQFNILFTEKDRKLFLMNKFPAERLKVIPQALGNQTLKNCLKNMDAQLSNELKVGYIGRVRTLKGCHLLIQALKLHPPQLPIKLDIYGCQMADDYCQQLKKMSAEDSRINLHELIPLSKIIEKYAEFDVICIPSIAGETGPLTLFEGVYSGCEVAGSNQIGQLDFLKKYGKLIEPNTPEAWSKFLQQCVTKLPQIRAQRKKEFSEIYDTDNVARQILALLKKTN